MNDDLVIGHHAPAGPRHPALAALFVVRDAQEVGTPEALALAQQLLDEHAPDAEYVKRTTLLAVAERPMTLGKHRDRIALGRGRVFRTACEMRLRWAASRAWQSGLLRDASVKALAEDIRAGRVHLADLMRGPAGR